MKLWPFKRQEPAPDLKYEYVVICMERPCGPLERYLSEGWEPVCSWREDRRWQDYAWINHMLLRRPR